jgi:hypothetical protein
MSVTVYVVTENTKLFEALHFVEPENSGGFANATSRLLEKLPRSKKIAPPPQPTVVFKLVQSVPLDVLDSEQDYVIVYHSTDLEALKPAVKMAGSYGVFIVCAEDSNEIAAANEMFDFASTVDVVSRKVCEGDDFSLVLLSVVMKRALREAGFME